MGQFKVWVMIMLPLNLGCAAALDTLTGNGDSPEQTRLVDTKLESAVRSFEHELGREVTYPVQVGRLDAKTVGRCEIWETGERRVTISSDYVDIITPNQLEEVVWHELGHCSLNRPHKDGSLYKDRLPTSVMNPYVFSAKTADEFEEEKAYYTAELFGR